MSTTTEPPANTERYRIAVDLGDGGSNYLDKHFDDVKWSIAKRAAELADQENDPDRPLKLRFIVEATKEFAPGPRIIPTRIEPESNFWQRVTSGITGVTLVAALLAIVFGVLSIYNAAGQQGPLSEIAKLMAGAIIGSTGAAVATTRRG